MEDLQKRENARPTGDWSVVPGPRTPGGRTRDVVVVAWAQAPSDLCSRPGTKLFLTCLHLSLLVCKARVIPPPNSGLLRRDKEAGTQRWVCLVPSEHSKPLLLCLLLKMMTVVKLMEMRRNERPGLCCPRDRAWKRLNSFSQIPLGGNHGIASTEWLRPGVIKELSPGCICLFHFLQGLSFWSTAMSRVPRTVAGAWWALRNYLLTVWVTLLHPKVNPLLFLFSLRCMCQIHCNWVPFTPKIRVTFLLIKEMQLVWASAPGPCDQSPSHCRSPWSHPLMTLSLRINSIGIQGLFHAALPMLGPHVTSLGFLQQHPERWAGARKPGSVVFYCDKNKPQGWDLLPQSTSVKNPTSLVKKELLVNESSPLSNMWSRREEKRAGIISILNKRKVYFWKVM